MPATEQKKKKTLNAFMLKSIVDDTNGGLYMLGTFVQRVYHLDEHGMEKFYFKYRFNELEPNNEHLQKRKTQPLKEKEKDKNGNPIVGTRSTFQAKIPLSIDTLHSIFPFQINIATAKIELSSDAEYSPNLLVDKNDRRVAISIQTLAEKDGMIEEGIGLPINKFDMITHHILKKIYGEEKYDKIELNRILDKIDCSKNFDFLSPHPIVRFQYDNDKKSCSTFTLSFYIVTKGFDRWVQLVFPIFIVTLIAGMNSAYDHGMASGVEATAHFQISSALTLAVVFILPQALDNRNRKSQLFTSQDILIIIFFVALLLSTIPKVMVGTAAPELFGVTLMFIFVFCTFYNAVEYIAIQRKVYREALAQQSKEKYKFLNKKVEDISYKNLKTINEFWDGNDFDSSLYVLNGERGRYSYLNYALKSE